MNIRIQETTVCGSRWNQTTHSWSIPHDVCYRKLCLPSLSARWDYLSVCALRDIRHAGSIKFSNYCTYNTMPMRSHNFTLIPPPSSINARQYSYLSVLVLCGTKYQSVVWELRAVLFSPRYLQTFLL